MRPNSCLSVLAVIGCFAVGSAANARNCEDLSAEDVERLQQYVAKRYRLSGTPALKVGAVEASCHRPVVFSSQSESSYFYRKFYLSADHRFLIQEYEDTFADPRKMEQRERSKVRHEVRATEAPTIGRDGAPVEIVVFSDLQCAYCRRGIQVLVDAVSRPDSDATLTYRHFPMSFHSWARRASDGTACLALQDQDAFWAAVAELLDQQSDLTADTLDKRIDLIASSRGLDLEALENCKRSGDGKAIVDNDIETGLLHEVKGTPTFFVNGHRFNGVSNAEQILSLISQAVAEAIAGRTGSED